MTRIETSAPAPKAGFPIAIGQCVHGLGIGGAQQVIRYIAQCGDRERFRHYVYTPEDGVLRPALEAAGATIRVVPRHIPKFDPLWVRELARAFRADGVRLVHGHLFGDTLHAYPAARSLGLPVVMTLHNVAQNFSPLQLWGYARLLGRVDRAIACSPSSYASFSALLAGRGRLEMIANGVPAALTRPADPVALTAVRRSLRLPDEAMTIGAMGRLVEAKGFGHLIAAFRIVREKAARDVRLVIVGTGPLDADLRRQAEQAEIGDNVVFTGYRGDTSTLMRAFDVLAFSSTHEGMPMTLLEGMAARRCVVATSVPGLAEILTDATALLVPPRDPDALAAALLRAIGDTPLRERTADAAQAVFLQRFTAEDMTKKYETVYVQTLDMAAGVAQGCAHGGVA